MFAIVSGIALFAGASAALWYCLPTNGQPIRLAVMPVFDTMIPIGIISAFALGVSLVVSVFF